MLESTPEGDRQKPRKRPKNIIDAIERIAAQDGCIESVDENYYQAFLTLPQQQVEKLAVAVMLDQEREVRRLAGGKTDPTAVASVAKLVRHVFTAISIGLARFDAFGRLGFVSRIGFEPEPDTDDALTRRYEEIAPIITNIVRRTLPWLLSKEISQIQLPL